ncbi:MAG TPA: hypothetical protein VIK14_08200 [Ignavibacteria bacterium]
MELLEKNNFAFKALSEKFIGWNAFKCGLFDEDYNPYDLYFNIATVHLKPLFETTDNELAIGEYGRLREYENSDECNYDEIKLTIVFNLEGVFFEAHYVINIANGEVAFEMDKPIICVKDFIVPADMDSGLAELIKEKMKTDNRLVSIDDARFDAYFSEKFLSTFIDYVGYLEELVPVENSISTE